MSLHKATNKYQRSHEVTVLESDYSAEVALHHDSHNHILVTLLLASFLCHRSTACSSHKRLIFFAIEDFNPVAIGILCQYSCAQLLAQA